MRKSIGGPSDNNPPPYVNTHGEENAALEHVDHHVRLSYTVVVRSHSDEHALIAAGEAPDSGKPGDMPLFGP